MISVFVERFEIKKKTKNKHLIKPEGYLKGKMRKIWDARWKEADLRR